MVSEDNEKFLSPIERYKAGYDLSESEFSYIANVSKATTYRLMKKGQLESYSINRSRRIKNRSVRKVLGDEE